MPQGGAAAAAVRALSPPVWRALEEVAPTRYNLVRLVLVSTYNACSGEFVSGFCFHPTPTDSIISR